MRIAIVKPDYGIIGGFELVSRRIERELRQQGHTVAWLIVDVPRRFDTVFGVEIPDPTWERCQEFFRYAGLMEAFARVDASAYDLVISTQPPSFGVRHPRHLSIFYHHLRICYDLSDVYISAGFVDPDLHRVVQHAVRALDRERLGEVQHFLTPSQVVRDRLRTFNGLTDNLGPFQAGPGLPEDLIESGPADPQHHVLCVGRHEFPKRTELFVHAMAYLPDRAGVLVGSGGRLPWIRSLVARLRRPGVRLDDQTDEDLWLCQAPESLLSPFPVDTNLRIVEHANDALLAGLYRTSTCVVAPALMEDYGLTAVEAISWGKPLVVCNDGGGLTEFVEDGVSGFVVEPRGKAIAEAVNRLLENPDLAREMGARGREVARQFTWERALAQLTAGIAQVMA